VNIVPYYYPQEHMPLDRVKFSFENKLYTIEYQKRSPSTGDFITMDFIIFPPETPVYILIERLEDYYRSKAYTSK
tara:strand:+ start:205 stop:429 length:225 start_codon:yes stop_codon:yes gene_type:complete